MKKTLSIILFTMLSLAGYSQKVFSVKYPSQADIKVFVVKYESQCDLKVYKVDYVNQAEGNAGLWSFVSYESQAKRIR